MASEVSCLATARSRLATPVTLLHLALVMAIFVVTMLLATAATAAAAGAPAIAPLPPKQDAAVDYG